MAKNAFKISQPLVMSFQVTNEVRRMYLGFAILSETVGAGDRLELAGLRELSVELGV